MLHSSSAPDKRIKDNVSYENEILIHVSDNTWIKNWAQQRINRGANDISIHCGKRYLPECSIHPTCITLIGHTIRSEDGNHIPDGDGDDVTVAEGLFRMLQKYPSISRLNLFICWGASHSMRDKTLAERCNESTADLSYCERIILKLHAIYQQNHLLFPDLTVVGSIGMVTYGSNGRTCTSKERQPVIAENYFQYDALSGLVAINALHLVKSYSQCKQIIPAEENSNIAEIKYHSTSDDDSSSEDCNYQNNRKKGNTYNVLRDIFPEAKDNEAKNAKKMAQENASKNKII